MKKTICNSKMAVGPVDPREVLEGVENLLGKDGELRSLEGVARVFSLMKASHKMVSRCMYLNILLHTKSHDILNRFIRVGGYKLLNGWLTYSKTTTNTPLLQLILLILQKLPLTVDHLKQNNTAKLVKQLSKSGETEEKKRKKEEGKPRAAEAKAGEGGKVAEEEKKKERKEPKAHAPSHAKSRSTGLELETPSPIPAKKPPVTPQIGDKYNIKPAVLKRPSSMPSDTPPVEKKYKPLNTTPNATKEIKVKIIPAQRKNPMEATGFLDALNSAPVPGIKIKKKKKPSSPTSNKSCPFESKSPAYPHTKPSSPEGAASHTPPHENADLEQPGTPVPSDSTEAMDTMNVNKIKDFGEAARRELMMDRQTFEMARRLSHDTMEERTPWAPPRPLILPPNTLVSPGANSTERHTQRDREMGILQEIFLSKESVPDSPHEPDPEPYEPTPPRLIPLDEDCSAVEESYMEPMDTSAPAMAPVGPPEGAKLPPQNPAQAPPTNMPPPGLLGHAPSNMNPNMNMPMNGSYPPNKPMQNPPQYPHPPPPHNHAPPYPSGGGPRMMGPPRGGEGGGYWGEEPMRGGGHHRGGGHFHRGRGGGGRGGEPGGYRGRGGRGGPRGGGGGPNNSHMGDMSNRPVCRHFMMKGSCRYENNCAFYHPGVNGPPLP
ncbi:hypothetical protein JZ751_004294 [Albula glossodonta]|uniref:C3H1-type domain-containing protein n=1 Tax=Albula glossodonta TaxID=121402 RepID=A0A8T2N5T2_9TELE|nr:hypothetical protein JZ751_004294 [Albula glossodonta]